jgi:outer membrane lipoprotein-sorting protein
MSIFTNRPALRWVVPVAAVAVVVGGGAAVGTLAASADPALPPRSAAQLLVDLQTARLDGLSGTVVQRADLGLPALPAIGAPGGADLATLASGTHTLRVWYAGPQQQRLALVGTLGETDVIHNGRDLWTWSSKANEATHRRLPAGAEGAEQRPEKLPTALPSTPQQAAEQVLAAVDPSTEVSVGRSARVAGRDAYELVLAPRDKASLVHQVRVAIDAREHVPLRLEVFAAGIDRAVFEVAFTQVDFTRPDAAQFVFNPPPGAKVTEQQADGRPDGHTDRSKGDAERPTAVGTGWTTVLVGRTPGDAQAGRQAGSERSGDEVLGGLLNAVPKVSGDWGSGRLLSTRLVTVLLTDDGRVLAGAVTPERLYEVARTSR